MPGAARAKLDPVGAGVIISGSCDVLVNGKQAARVGDPVSPHISAWGAYHKKNTIILGECTVLVNGKPMAHQGSLVSCGDIVLLGSCDVLVG